MRSLQSLRTAATFFSLSFALCSGPARADTPSICAGTLFPVCISALLQQRCASYADYNLFSKREFYCESSAQTMVRIFSPYQPKGEVNVVAFPHQISTLVQNKKAIAFLRDLPKAIRSAIENSTPFRLWGYAVKKADGNEMTALKWLSVLLQDTTPTDNLVVKYARVNFGKINERPLTEEETDLWSKAIEAISYDRLSDSSEESGAIFIRPYPSIDSEFLSKGFYHFYFAAYMARALQVGRKSLTPAGKDMNAFAPFLLNALYEMHMDIDDKLSPLDDAKPFDPKEKWHSLQDLYTSYLGSLFGMGGEAAVAKAEPFSIFSARFSKNPRGTMKSLYLNFIPK